MKDIEHKNPKKSTLDHIKDAVLPAKLYLLLSMAQAGVRYKKK